MKQLIIMGALLMSVTAYSQEVDTTFRGMKFGEDIKTFSGLVLDKHSVDNGLNTSIYRKVKENLTIGDTKLKGIQYVFYKNKLCSIIISAEHNNTYDVYHPIYKALKDKYSAYEKHSGRWEVDDITIVFHESSYGVAAIYYLYEPLWNEMQLEIIKEKERKEQEDIIKSQKDL